MNNKYTVIIHCQWDEGGFFEHYPACTKVESAGPILCFIDQHGTWHKTSAPWTISQEKGAA